MAQAKPTALKDNLPHKTAKAAADVCVDHGLPRSGFVTAEWVKRRYSISNSTLYAWIADKRFPAPVKIGPRAVRWSTESLRKFEAKVMEDGH